MDEASLSSSSSWDISSDSSSSWGTSDSSYSSYSSEEYDFCYDISIEEMLKPHRIPVTILASISAACMIVGSVYLLFQRNSFIFKRKAALYLVWATLGLLLYLRDSFTIIWTFPAYTCDASSFYLYYLGAVPFHILPLLVRSWRTYCIYRETFSIFTCTKDSMLSEKVRRHLWMIWRIGLCYLLFLLAIALVAIDEDYAYYTWIAVESYFSLIFIVLAYKLYSIRSELRSKLLDETKSLFLYAIVVAIEVIYSNAVYIMSYQRYEDTYLIYIMCMEICS